MGPLVCMSLEEMERSVSTEGVAALNTHQDCGDVIFLTPVKTCRASTSILALMNHIMVTINKLLHCTLVIMDLYRSG